MPPTIIEPAAPYSAYARHYDRQGQSQWSVAAAHFALEQMLPRYGRRATSVLDLACGTGAALQVFAGAGLVTVGLDRSPAILARARERLRQGSSSLVCADLRAFAFRRQFTLITSFYDSLNYLLDPEDLVAAFGNARAALAPGGLLLCDLTTPAAYAAAPAATLSLDLDDIRYTWRTDWQTASQLATTTLGWSWQGGSASEIHRQRAYTEDEALAALVAAGLRPRESFAVGSLHRVSFDRPGPATPRILYVAERARERGK